MKRGKLATRNINTELVYNISATRNISKALKQFGIADTSTYVLAVVFSPCATKLAALRQAVEGAEVQVASDSLGDLADEALVRKVYGISDVEARAGSLVDSIVTRMACRDVR